MAPPPAPPAQPRKRRVWLIVTLSAFAVVAVTGIAGALAGLYYVYSVTRDLPDYEALAHYEPPVTTRVYAGDGSLIGEYARERRLFVPIDSVPQRVIQAFLAAEDKNFFEHSGIDYTGIARAAINNAIGYLEGDTRLEGASTITQQVARNFLLTSEQKLERKVREAVLAMRISEAFSKEKVLELYLNQIFLGQNSYGVAAAALNYFDKSLDELTIAEAAYLAALPKAPSNYHPVRQKAAAIARRNWVIGQMARNGYISEEAAREAMAEDLVAHNRPFGAQTEDSEYFVEEVRRILYERYGESALYDGGLSVRATLDPRLQTIAVKALRDGLITYDRRHGWRGPVATIEMSEGWQDRLAAVGNNSGVSYWEVGVVTGLPADGSAEIGFADGTSGRIPLAELAWARKKVKTWLGPEVKSASDVVAIGDVVYVERLNAAGVYGLRQVPEINGAIIALDPHTGRVLAMSGGFSFASSQFNRATQALRQPGSAFKPFVYAAALDQGYTPVSKVLDAPFVMEQGPGLPLWKPENYSDKFYGLSTLRRGVELSRNVMTVRLAQDLGMDIVAEYAIRLGVYDDLPRMLSMALGAGETTLLRLTTGYAEIVNGGRKVTPTLIDRIQDRTGANVYRHDERPCDGCAAEEWAGQPEPLLTDTREDVLDPRTAYQIVSILEGVVLRGTARRVAEVGKPLAGKTGTSNEERDVWFVGFSPDLVAGVYVGFDLPRPLGRGEAGGLTAAPIFRDFMRAALEGEPATPFRIPPGVVLVSINPRTGEPATPGDPYAILEAFKAGTEPTLDGEHAAIVAPALRIGADGMPVEDDSPDITAATSDNRVGQGTGGLY